jgi:hypothetical protein
VITGSTTGVAARGTEHDQVIIFPMSLSQERQKQQQQQQKQEYAGMAKFGQSFADMAEAMLADEYKSSHHVDDLKTISSSQRVSSILEERNGGAGASGGGMPPSALKRKSSDEGFPIYNNNNANNNANSCKVRIAPDTREDARPLTIQSSDRRTLDSRSVVIQDPPKRQRIRGNYSASDVVHELNRAVSQEERLEAIQNAIITFDHDEPDLHDDEIAAGADVALTKALVFLEFKAGFRREPIKADMEAISREIGLVLKALECVYR